MDKASEAFRWRTPIREMLRIPDSITGTGVCAAVLGAFFPAHPEIASGERGRHVVWLGRDGQPYDPVALTKRTGKGEHDLQAAACTAGTGAGSAGKYCGVAPRCRLVLSAHQVLGGDLRPSDHAQDLEDQLTSMLPLVDRHGVAGLSVGAKGRLAGPLVPWQWDKGRRCCEQLADKGALVVSRT